MQKSTIFHSLVLSGIALAMTACSNLSDVSNAEEMNNLVFPKISELEFNQEKIQSNSSLNWDAIRQVKPGMNKEQIQELIGLPYFFEGGYSLREWDYAFSYSEKGVNKICQFKILFDKNMNAQSLFWYPNGCENH